MAGKLGCKPFIHTPATHARMQLAEKALAALGAPPKQCYPWHDAVENATGGDWGMDGNDQVGDCVIAGRAHQIMAFTANRPGGSIVIPTTAETLSEYSIETGYVAGESWTDQGTDPVANANAMVEKGMLVGSVVHKVDAWVAVDPANTAARQWAKHLFCGGGLCVNLPNSAMSQFDAGDPWTVVANDGGIAGGHYVLDIYYYMANGVLWSMPVTWGQIVTATEEWVQKYAMMYIAYLSKDFVNQAGLDAAGIDYAALVADLQAVKE